MQQPSTVRLFSKGSSAYVRITSSIIDARQSNTMKDPNSKFRWLKPLADHYDVISINMSFETTVFWISARVKKKIIILTLFWGVLRTGSSKRRAIFPIDDTALTFRKVNCYFCEVSIIFTQGEFTQWIMGEKTRTFYAPKYQKTLGYASCFH